MMRKNFSMSVYLREERIRYFYESVNKKKNKSNNFCHQLKFFGKTTLRQYYNQKNCYHNKVQANTCNLSKQTYQRADIFKGVY